MSCRVKNLSLASEREAADRNLGKRWKIEKYSKLSLLQCPKQKGIFKYGLHVFACEWIWMLLGVQTCSTACVSLVFYFLEAVI